MQGGNVDICNNNKCDEYDDDYVPTYGEDDYTYTYAYTYAYTYTYTYAYTYEYNNNKLF